jgi:hypothetical protein
MSAVRARYTVHLHGILEARARNQARRGIKNFSIRFDQKAPRSGLKARRGISSAEDRLMIGQ